MHHAPDTALTFFLATDIGPIDNMGQAIVQRVTSLLMITAGAVASGSHSDSIVQGGAYDGALGVIGAIAAVQVAASPAPSAESAHVGLLATHHHWADITTRRPSQHGLA